MPKREGRYVIGLPNAPAVISWASAVGKTESEGPLADEFDVCYPTDKICEGSWEMCESRLAEEALGKAFGKCGKTYDDADILFAGDLLNQCVASTFAARGTDIPYAGLFGACSTMALAAAMAALCVDSGAAKLAGACASSHFCSAERQFRFPLEYGGQRTPTAQRTVTGAGAMLISDSENELPRITRLMIGRIRDQGITDANNMGAAMAPAAACTIIDFLRDTQTSPSDYDLILTGDLGKIGSGLLRELMITREKTDISLVHNDCGLMIYDLDRQNVYSGGSGCGCSASVVCSHILKKLSRGELHRVLYVATGALMSPTTAQQGENIPAIAHAVEICKF
ncbi:MAG: stage V sporulation protein AD [Clostridia bacterium]|nr:stage V sporulation protein AD [Clostridia bacterium]